MADTKYELAEDHKSPRPVWKTRAILALKILLVVVVFFIGFVIGYFVMKGSIPDDKAESSSQTAADYNEYATRLAESLQAKNIENFLKKFTKHPHMGGTVQNDKLANDTRDAWVSYKFDNVEMVRYDVLLSMPHKNKSNAVKVINTTNDDVVVNIEGPEKTKEASENDPSVAPPFLAYSPPGDVSGDLVYVNYGRVEDFAQLKALGQNCSGKIAIMRYGKIFRGNKVANAENAGAKGAILYSDPADYAPAGVDNTFPKTWWLPETGSQRGSIMGTNGDPLTPDLPSTKGIYRMNKGIKGIPGIPAQPMGYGDAIKLLSRMKGPEAPPSWRGGLAITYRLGPGFNESNLTLRLIVNNVFLVRPTYNVIGTIKGKEEPDRVVLLGNHRDAWVFGGVDPSSGSAVMMELSRGLGELMKTGWRPRRTIMFCSWGAEEYGLIGSWEWTEENQKWLGDRAITYINLDSAVSGNYSFSSRGNALLTGLIMDQTKKATDQNHGVSLYETWKKGFPGQGGKPYFGPLGSGSDYSHFAHFLGVPSIDMSYTFRSMNVSGYPVYHSVHDTFYWQKTFSDPYFKSHLTVSQIAARLLVAASDSLLIPFTLAPYSAGLASGFKDLKKNEGTRLQSHNITLDYLEEAINTFKKAVDDFESKIKEVKTAKDVAKIRALNDQVMLLERTFIWPYGLPGRSDVRHVIFAPSIHNQYGSSTFPGIGDVLFDIDKTDNWQEVKRQISIIIYSIRAASKAIGWMY